MILCLFFVYSDKGHQVRIPEQRRPEDLHVPGPDAHGGGIIHLHQDDCGKEEDTEGILFRIEQARKISILSNVKDDLEQI